MRLFIEKCKRLVGLDFWSQQAKIKARYSEYRREKRSIAAKRGWEKRRSKLQ